nr:hypothetical protein [Calditerricola satsumensis]
MQALKVLHELVAEMDKAAQLGEIALRPCGNDEMPVFDELANDQGVLAIVFGRRVVYKLFGLLDMKGIYKDDRDIASTQISGKVQPVMTGRLHADHEESRIFLTKTLKRNWKTVSRLKFLHQIGMSIFEEREERKRLSIG